MKVYLAIPQTLKPFYKKELAAYHAEMIHGDFQKAWSHLERAHIIGQRYPGTHTYVHWKMLQFGCSVKSIKEIAGQLPRLLVGGIKSFVGKVPVGNPGGSDVPPLKPFPIDAEIVKMFHQAGVEIV